MLEEVISQEASTTNNVDESNVNPSTDQLTLEEQRLSQKRLEALTRIFDYEITNTKDYLDYALDEVIAVTQSKIGYIYFYDEETEQFELNTWSKEAMRECKVLDPKTKYYLEKTGLWGEAVRQRKMIMTNNYSSHQPKAKGKPSGHVHLSKYLSVPVFKGDSIVAVVGVANKPTNYTEVDAKQLTLMMGSIWKKLELFNNQKS